MSLHVLVTGGSGFVGSHVVDALCAAGHKVRIFDLAPPRFRQDVEHCQGSITDLGALTEALSGIDAVYHLAAVADVKDVTADPVHAEAINVRGTLLVLEACLRATSVKRLVYGSTTWVYSNAAQDVVDEDTPLAPPDHFYTTTKLTGEHYCLAYQRRHGLPVTILRYGIPYGPRARDGAVIPTMIQKALRGEPLTIAGDGSQFRKFVYVEDLARGNLLALAKDAENKVFNLDGAEKVTIRRLAEIVGRQTGGANIVFTPPRQGDFGGKDVSSRRAHDVLGWAPQIDIDEGVKRCVAWHKQKHAAPSGSPAGVEPS